MNDGASIKASASTPPSLLSLSSSITEFLMETQDVDTLIFEIQELRHANSMSVRTSKGANGEAEGGESVSEVDTVLMRLGAKLEAVRSQYTTLASQVEPLLDPAQSTAAAERAQVELLQQKWADAVGEWESAQKDADVLGDELKEDKWLVVFRTVSAQAEDMMRSLEKNVAQARSFLDTIPAAPSSSYPSRRGLSRSPSEPVFSSPSYASTASFNHLSPTLASSLLSSLTTLLETLNTKSSYYAPATDRVLRILEKGVQERRTTNGEVVRRLGAMEGRWRELRALVGRVRGELEGAKEGLEAVVDRAQEGWGRKEEQTPTRRPTNALASSASSPSIATLGTVTSPDHYPDSLSLSRSTQNRPTPLRPPKSLKRLVSDSSFTPPRTPSASVSLDHRRSMSTIRREETISPSRLAFSLRYAAKMERLHPCVRKCEARDAEPNPETEIEYSGDDVA
ncbi:hypothetical protein JCM10295v2_006911 [Rhodotorula toruloides]